MIHTFVQIYMYVNAAKCVVSVTQINSDGYNHYDSLPAAFNGLSASQFEDINSHRGYA